MNEPSPNPFSTRFVRPGALAYVFAEGASLDQTLRRLEANQGWGQIIGPHGTGKSTLLASLLRRLEQRGTPTVLFELHDGQRWLPPGWRQNLRETAGGAIVAIDGYEQLCFWERQRVRRLCRRQRLGLLVTAHADVRFPPLQQTAASLEVARAIVNRLCPAEVGVITPEDVRRLHAACNGNLRETLFALYDCFNARRPPRGLGVPPATN